MNIVVKSGIEQLPLFETADFPFFEAYLKGDDDLSKLLHTKMKLVAVHLPATVQYQKKLIPLDFCGEQSEIACKTLKKVLEFCEAHEVKFIVVHLGFFNSLRDNRDKILKRTAKLFTAIKTTTVKICLENVPCWVNLCFENEPVISNVEHFWYFKKHCPSIGLTFDVDHLAITTVFQHFYHGFKAEYQSAINRPDFRRKMEREMMHHARQNPDFFRRLVQTEITAFLSRAQPDTVHAVGSDFCQYQDAEKLPLIGEALPLGFKGIIQNAAVEDKIDHARWIPLLKNDPYITLELLLRPDYDYLAEIKKSWALLSSFRKTK